MNKKIPSEKKGFNSLPEKVQKKINPRLANEYSTGGTVVKTFEGSGNHEQESGFGAVRAEVRSFGKGKA